MRQGLTIAESVGIAKCMRHSTLTDAEFQEAVQPGDTAQQIADRLKISSSYARIRCKALGIHLQKPQVKRDGKVDWTTINFEALTVAEIVARTGVSRARVYQKCRELGVQCRLG